MRVAVIVFPGSNCDNDAYNIFKNAMNLDTEFIWHKDNDLQNPEFKKTIIPDEKLEKLLDSKGKLVTFFNIQTFYIRNKN